MSSKQKGHLEFSQKSLRSAGSGVHGNAANSSSSSKESAVYSSRDERCAFIEVGKGKEKKTQKNVGKNYTNVHSGL